MRYTLIIMLLMVLAGTSVQAQRSCCSSPVQAFAGFGSEKAFVAAHEPPPQITYEPKIGRMVSLKTDDGKEVAVFEVKTGASIGKIILMFHEWWGLNDQMKQAAEKLHMETGATVLLLDLYDKKVTYNPDSAAKMMQAVNPERVQSIIRAAIEYGGKFSRFQTIGWCMGGGWSLQASISLGDKGYGCVIYYGMPEFDVAKLKQIKGPVAGFYGTRDGWISPELVKEFDQKMKVAGIPFTSYSYDADHAFANPSNQKYNKDATAKANAIAVEFLKKNFETPLRKTEGATEEKTEH
ncbi:MAG: dienelactone hydrolase family protein [Bacteroidia bacterium]